MNFINWIKLLKVHKRWQTFFDVASKFKYILVKSQVRIPSFQKKVPGQVGDKFEGAEGYQFDPKFWINLESLEPS